MKTVLVTGASRGARLAIAERLLADGHAVVAISRTSSDALTRLGEAFPGRLTFAALDLGDAEAVAQEGRRIVKAAGPVYGLVNNAATGSDTLFSLTRRQDIERILQVNLLGPILLTRQVVQSMLVRKEGRIVMISSINATTGFSGQTVYGASKAGLEGFARSLSREVGQRGVTVNCVAPGYMATDMTADLQGERLASVLRRMPLGPATAADVAGAVAYFLSDDAARTTGTVLRVDGGSAA